MVKKLMLAVFGVSFFIASSSPAAVVHRVLKKNQRVILKLSPSELSKVKKGDKVTVKLGSRRTVSGVAVGKSSNRLTIDLNKKSKRRLRLGQMVDLEKAFAAGDGYVAEEVVEEEDLSDDPTGPSFEIQGSSPSPFSDSFTSEFWEKNRALMYRVSSGRAEVNYSMNMSADYSKKGDTTDIKTKSIESSKVDVIAIAHVNPDLWVSANYMTNDVTTKMKDEDGKTTIGGTQMAIGVAYQFTPNLVAAVSLQSNTNYDKDDDKVSESFNRMEPALVYFIPGDLELGVSYRPTVRIIEKGENVVFEEGYFIVGVEKFVARDLSILGSIEHHRYSKLSEDFKDIFQFSGGATLYLPTGRLTGLASYQPVYHDNDEAATIGSIATIGLNAYYFHTISSELEVKFAVNYYQATGDGKIGTESLDIESKYTSLTLGGAYKF